MENQIIKKRRSKRWLIIIAVFLVLVLFPAALGLLAIQQVRDATKQLADISENASAGNFSAVQASTQEIDSHLGKALGYLKLTRAYWYIPIVGDNFETAFAEISGAETLIQVGDELITELNLDKDQANLEKFLAKIDQPAYAELENKLADKLEIMKKSPNRWLVTPVKENRCAIISQLTRANDIIGGLNRGSKILQASVGVNKPQNYLVLLQNNGELRPTGGIISGVGKLTIENGKIKDYAFADSSLIDQVNVKSKTEPPKPLKDYWYEPGESWRFSDANFSPDFPESLKNINKYYSAAGNTADFDGVLSIDTSVLKGLLKITGSVKLAGYPYEFTDENVTETLQKHVELDYKKIGVAEGDRKKIIADLGKELITRLSKLDFAGQTKAIDYFGDMLRQKHVLINLTEPAANELIVDFNWGGVMKKTSGDYLAVIDSNLGGWKSDRFIERKVNYKIVPDNGRLKATLNLEYSHLGGYDWQSSIYKTFTRVYVPAGSELVSVSGGVPFETEQELGKTVFSGYFSLEPKTLKQLTLTYLLPKSITESDYNIIIQKQAGVDGIDLGLNLFGGKRVVSQKLVSDAYYSL